MFRKFIEKYYKIIQWTKKWHFFHILVIIPGIFTLWEMISAFILYITKTPGTTNLDIILGDLYAAPLVLAISEFLMFFVAIVVEILVIIIRAIARKPFCVLSYFLSKNKIYNFIYCFFFFVIVLTILEFLLGLVLTELSDYIS